MKCPVCQETLTMSERQGVEIDFCPKCRGIWLDRGELDKILAREAALEAPSRPGRGIEPRQEREDDDDDDYRRGGDDGYGRRRRSLWQDLFD
jgi:Zn-finger nucleic acid-binding protein